MNPLRILALTAAAALGAASAHAQVARQQLVSLAQDMTYTTAEWQTRHEAITASFDAQTSL